LDYQPDPTVTVQTRFGVKTFIHPELDSHSQDISPKAVLAEVIAAFWAILQTQQQTSWTGTCTQLVEALKSNELADALDRNLSSVVLGRYLSGFEPDPVLGFQLCKRKSNGLTRYELKKV